MIYDFEKTLTGITKSVIDTFFLKKINKKNIINLFDVEKNDLSWNVII